MAYKETTNIIFQWIKPLKLSLLLIMLARCNSSPAPDSTKKKEVPIKDVIDLYKYEPRRTRTPAEELKKIGQIIITENYALTCKTGNMD